MNAIKALLQQFKENQLDQITLECQQHSGITEEIPSYVIAITNYLAPPFWTRLISLNLQDCQMKQFPVCLKVCECLQELNISRNCIQQLPSLLFIYYFPFLKILDISDNYISNLGEIQLLGQLNYLEVLSCQGNNFSQISNRICLINQLLLQNQTKRPAFLQKNRMSVFMDIGDENVVKSNESFREAMKLLVKAADYIKYNDLVTIKPQLYELNQLPVDAMQLSNGSLFQIKSKQYIKGPGITLIRDERIEAPMIVVTTNQQSELQEISPLINNYINYNAEQFDAMLGNKQSLFADQKQIQFGFFGERYFCYDQPLKTRQKQLNNKQLSTVDFIKKQVIRDQRIISTANQAKLDKYQLDSSTMLPSQIQKQLLSKTQEMHFITNLNQRKLYTTENFPRLRVLNAQIITISDYDEALKVQKEEFEMKNQMRLAAQPLQQNLAKIPVASYSQKAQNSSKITGQAAEDLKCEASAISINRELSEAIRKRQVYERVLLHNDLEKKKARKELKDFIQSGNLKNDDQEYQMSMLLRAYDEEEDPDINTFTQKVMELQRQYALDRENREQEKAEDDGIVPNLLSEDLTMSQIFKKDQEVTLQRTNNMEKSLRMSELNQFANQLEEKQQEKIVLSNLSQLTSSVGVSHRNFKSNLDKNAEPQQQQESPQQSKQVKDRIYDIEMAVLQSQIALSEQSNQKMNSEQQNLSNLDIMRPHLQNSNPLIHVQQSTHLYAEADDYVPDKISLKSSIAQKYRSNNPEKIPLPLETNHLNFADLKTVPDEIIEQTKGLQSINGKQLVPSFEELIRTELQVQHQANNELFKHVSESVDPNIRHMLSIPKYTYQTKDTPNSDILVNRHTVLLDVVHEGDRLRAAPANLITKKNKDKLLKYTTSDIITVVDNKLMQQDLNYELEKSRFKNSANTIKQMQKQTAEDIENQLMTEKRQEHLRRLQVISKEKPMPQYYNKPSGQLILYAKQRQKVVQLEQKNAIILNRKTNILNSQSQQQQRATKNILDIETVEQAAEHARELKINAGELIDAGTYVISHAQETIDELDDYGQQFISDELQWAELQSDPVYRLTRDNGNISTVQFQEPQNDDIFNLSEDSKRLGQALLRGKSTKGLFKPQLYDAKCIAEDIIDQLYRAK